MAVPRGIKPGSIYHHSQFYRDQSGQFKAKFFLVLAHSTSDEIVARLLTSKPHGRRKNPPCFHGLPYPGYYLGNLNGVMRHETWVDLRALEDFDGKALAEFEAESIVEPITELTRDRFIDVLDCAASAEDTTRYQESLIRDLRAKIAEA